MKWSFLLLVYECIGLFPIESHAFIPYNVLTASPRPVALEMSFQKLLVNHSNRSYKRKHQNPITSVKGRLRELLAGSEVFASEYDIKYSDRCDVLILGSGPAARSLASLLSSTKGIHQSKSGLDILLADSNFNRKWTPNYGVWKDEWDCICQTYETQFGRVLGRECIDREWSVTDCYFGGSFDIPTEQRFRLDRPYYRIAKNELQKALTVTSSTQDSYRVITASHISTATSVNIYTPAGSLLHDDEGSTIILQEAGDSGGLVKVRTKLIVDCTGHETKIVLKDSRTKSIPPGFQIAYGVLATVDESQSLDLTHIGPYDKEAMTLFDYRTDHFDCEELSIRRKANDSPTFMYVMPLTQNRVFFEETSLVARPALSFQECKDRFLTRMKYLGISINSTEEEEFCYIPMGGPLPEKDQRVVAFGGAAVIVHPSTGYNLCRNMISSVTVADTIRKGLLSDKKPDLDVLASRVYHAIWSPSNIRQRNFAVFGGEFLMKQNVEGLRGFFDGFFRLPLELWAGFLAGWPGLPYNSSHETWFSRLFFGLNFVSKLPFKVAADMLTSIIAYCISEGAPLLQSVTPLLGEPEGFEYKERPKVQGDIAAKSEAKQMIIQSAIKMEIPVDFVRDENPSGVAV